MHYDMWQVDGGEIVGADSEAQPTLPVVGMNSRQGKVRAMGATGSG